MKIPHAEQYNGPFAMEAGAFNALIDYANRIDLQAHVAAMRVKADAGDGLDVMPAMTMTEDGIVVIECIGTLTKYGSSLSDGPSTVALRQCIRNAAADPKCTGIMLQFDSPGGTADGTLALATDIAAAAATKPTWASVDGMAASAAYWAASQCNQIVATGDALVGSIGTYGVVYDRSEQFSQAGVKAYVLRAGEHKGSGAPGEKITDAQLADKMRVINEINDLFINGVAQGRRISQKGARDLNDGRIHVGDNAKAKGLVDQIGSPDQAMAGLRAAIAKRGGSQRTQPRPQPSPQAAAPQPTKAPIRAAGAGIPTTLHELKEHFPKSNADWRAEILENDMTLAQAYDSWLAHLSASLQRGQS